MPSHSAVLTGAIRRDILSVLGGPAELTVPAATARVAAAWSSRRRRCGASPSSASTAAVLVHQVGADLPDEDRGEVTP
jgi:hypothetical protein